MLQISRTPETASVPLGDIAGAKATHKAQRAERSVQLYGWDSLQQAWHGPNELSRHAGSQRLADALRKAPGKSWYGPVNCSTSGEPRSRLFAVVHALHDCGVATIYCDESKAGPAEILVVIPAEQRPRLRPEFAFEFVAFAAFLGSLGTGSDLAVHDCIVNALAETDASESLVFSVSTGLWDSDRDYVLSRCVEKVAVAMLEWLEAM